uniref:N-acetyltransferase domain-containing protein n=1 Tax=viral metagenome TaxID=1070528 RepID=A0A6C0BE88_9ZZZZ
MPFCIICNFENQNQICEQCKNFTSLAISKIKIEVISLSGKEKYDYLKPIKLNGHIFNGHNFSSTVFMQIMDDLLLEFYNSSNLTCLYNQRTQVLDSFLRKEMYILAYDCNQPRHGYKTDMRFNINNEEIIEDSYLRAKKCFWIIKGNRIEHIWIHKDSRQKGLARKIVNICIQWGVEKTVQVTDSSIEFWRKMGFQTYF